MRRPRNDCGPGRVRRNCRPMRESGVPHLCSTECEMINRNIRIGYNEFSNLIRTALDISSVSGLELMNNEFVSCASPIIQMRCSAKTHLARNRASEPNVIVFDAPTWQADRKIEDNANMDARSSL